MVTCYAPTEEAEKEEKENFYDSLQSILEDIPKHDVLVVLGDFNARVGSDNTNRERIMGKHGTGTMTAASNGSRLCDICGENDLVIGGTLFQHKTIHKLTWRSPDGRTEIQIDHIVVNGKWRRSLQDVKTRRLADVGSDHNLLIGKLALKLRKAKTGEKKKERFDTTKLQNPETKQKFTIALKNSFGILQEETEMTIHSFNMAMELAGKAVLGCRRAKKEQWMSACNTWRGITLLSMTCKIFSRIIMKRISAATDTILRQEQAGFRRGKSCIDHIFTLRQILEQSTEWNSTIYIAFIDFEKAFDSLHRESLWRILCHYGIPQKMVNVI